MRGDATIGGAGGQRGRDCGFGIADWGLRRVGRGGAGGREDGGRLIGGGWAGRGRGGGPRAVRSRRTELSGAPARPHWPMWGLVVVYRPGRGILWPVGERYLSGGRSGAGLRRALGRWNITWSSALVVALWAMGPV